MTALARAPRLVIVSALVVVTVALFGRVVAFDFINFDDPLYVTANRHVQAGLTCETAWWALTTTEVANWHPLTWLSLELDTSLFGRSPAGFHATNLALHVANTVLLFLALSRMT